MVYGAVMFQELQNFKWVRDQMPLNPSKQETNFISALHPYMYKKKLTYTYLKTMTNKN